MHPSTIACRCILWHGARRMVRCRSNADNGADFIIQFNAARIAQCLLTCKVSQRLATPGGYPSLSLLSKNSDELLLMKSCTMTARSSVSLLLPLHWVGKYCWKRCWFPCGEVSMGRRLWRPGMLTEGVEILTSFLEWIMQKQVLTGHYIPLNLAIQSTDISRCSNYTKATDWISAGL